jgi:SAM-dependent methyltransferase
MSSYEALADHYDIWAREVADDIDFYVQHAVEAGGPVVELGVGTGRIAIPTALAGVRVIGVDSSARMLELCARRAADEGVADLLDLRLGTFQQPPVEEGVRLVTCPFRSFLHLLEDGDRRQALAAVHSILLPHGRFVLDGFAPWPEDTGSPADDWVERAPGILEQRRVDLERRIIDVTLRTSSGDAKLRLGWLERDEWRALLEETGFRIRACYGAFDLRPCSESISQSVWVAEKMG